MYNIVLYIYIISIFEYRYYDKTSGNFVILTNLGMLWFYVFSLSYSFAFVFVLLKLGYYYRMYILDLVFALILCYL